MVVGLCLWPELLSTGRVGLGPAARPLASNPMAEARSSGKARDVDEGVDWSLGWKHWTQNLLDLVAVYP